MAAERALITAPLRGPGLARLEALLDITYDPWIDHRPLRIHRAEELAARVAELGARILIVETDAVSGPVLEQPLRLIASTRGDPNNVDLAAATAAGIPVVNTPGRNADAVAELAVALLFALTRGIVAADADVRAGQVYRDNTIPYQRFRAWELSGRTVGLVGYGAVGRALAWRLRGLGLTVRAFDPYHPDGERDLHALLSSVDIVSMHAPVTAESVGMIGTAEFAEMRPGTVYLNTARAQLHDTDALVAALQSGHLAGAGLDHFVGERLATDHPLVSMSNVVLTPHIGGATWDTEARQTDMVADDVTAVLEGRRPTRLVNPEVWTGAT